jgi:hypothetical protein
MTETLACFSQFAADCDSDGVGLLFGRLNCNARLQIAAAQAASYAFVESSMTIRFAGMKALTRTPARPCVAHDHFNPSAWGGAAGAVALRTVLRTVLSTLIRVQSTLLMTVRLLHHPGLPSNRPKDLT